MISREIRYMIGLFALGLFSVPLAWFAQYHRPFTEVPLGYTWATIFCLLWLFVGIVGLMLGEPSSTPDYNREV